MRISFLYMIFCINFVSMSVHSLRASESATRCCITDEIQGIINACCSVLSELSSSLKDDIIGVKNDVSTLTSKIDALNQCTVGTQITQSMVPYTITQPGHYYVCESLSASGAPTITINASNVVLNLNGFSVANTNNKGIVTSGAALSNITVQNGSINTVSALAMDMNNVTNLKVINATIVTTSTSAFAAGTVNNLVMDSCRVVAGSLGSIAVQLTGIAGGLITNISVDDFTFSTGFSISSVAANTTLEFINCVADTVMGGFVLSSTTTGSVIFRSCVANGAAQGFYISGTALLEDCKAFRCGLSGFWILTASDVVLKNCTAELSSGGSGFRARAATRLVCEGCIAQNNSTVGFFLEGVAGPNVNCVFNESLALSNGTDGFKIDSNSANARVTNCIASGNVGSGINNLSASTVIADGRSQHAATANNPAYNLNGAANVLSGATMLIVD